MNNEFIAHYREKDGEPQYLWEHLEETSSLVGKFAEKIGLKKHGELSGLLHDIGKATNEFYQYIGSVTGLIDPDEDDYVDATGRKGKIDHSSAGAQVIYRHFSDKGNESLFINQILSLIVASHHSGLIDCITPDGQDNYSRRMNKPDGKTRIEESLSNLDDKIKRKIESLLSNDSLISDFNQKLKFLQESNDSKETLALKFGMLVRFLFSCLIDADRLNTADFEFPERAKLRNQGEYVSWSDLSEKLNQHLRKIQKEAEITTEKQEKVQVLRKEISTHCLEFSTRPNGLFQLTVPTGGGKTLSSLRFALNHAKENGMDRILYVIPYTSIIDQNADTVRKILEDQSDLDVYLDNIVLEHHSNLTPDEETTRQKLLAENWDAPVVFTTMVQFLETLFGYGTRSARRMHQLANSIIIFDEIQTLPIECVHLFNMAIRFLIKGCGSTVVLCTATQPLLDEVKPVQRALQITSEQQMMPDVQKLFEDLKRVKVYDRRKVGGWTYQEIAELTETELVETGSVLNIVNTKKAAINLFRQLQNYSIAAVYHLSTSMCPAHRMKILDEVKGCLSEKKPVICISTQLIEAGVDIDFGTVIRYLAGLDSIAQAAGRCNRNGARPMGRVFIINPKEENLDRLKDIKIGKDTADRILDEFQTNSEQFDGDILGLKAMERYYQYYFYQRSNEMDYPVSSNSEAGRSDKLFNLLSTNQNSIEAYRRINNQSYPLIMLRQSFMTAAKVFQAIDSYTRGVIVPYREGEQIINELCASKDLEKQYNLLKKAQRYSVNVFSYMFDKLVKERIIHEVSSTGVFYLDKQYYSKDFGLSESQVNEMDLLIVEEG